MAAPAREGPADLEEPRFEEPYVRNRGSVLIVAVLFIILFLGMSVALMTQGVGVERDVRASLFTDKAVYLAETGVGESIRELGNGVDAAGDGLGSVSGSVAGGRYQTAATARPGGEGYDVVSVGFFDQYRFRLEVFLEPTFRGIGTLGSLGFSGYVPDPADLALKLKNNQLAIDGGERPAITVQDPVAYQKVVAAIIQGIQDGLLSPSQFTGSPMMTFPMGTGTVELPFQQVTSPPVDAVLLNAIRTELHAHYLTSVVPTANLVINNVKQVKATNTWGTATDPQVVVFPRDTQIAQDTQITGHGTLIVEGDLTLTQGVKLNWTGDVVLLGGVGGKDARLLVDGGQVNVTGNVALLEGINGKAILDVAKVHSSTAGSTVVNGAVMVLSGPMSNKVDSLRVSKSDLIVNGLLAMSGENVWIRVQKDGGRLIVNGSTQIGTLDGPGWTPEMKWNVEGYTHFYYNEELVLGALQGILDLLERGQLSLSLQNQLMGFVQRAWRASPLPY